MNNFKSPPLPVIALLMLTLATIWWAVHQQPLQAEVQSGDWQWIEPQLLESRLGLVGHIRSAHQYTLTAPFEATVGQVHVREGQQVQSGQLLISLDPARINTQQRQAQAQLLKARREVLRLQRWSDSSEVTRARRQVNAARQNLAQARASLTDTKALFARGIVARMDVDALRQQVDNLQRDLLGATEELHSTLRQGQDEALEIAQLELANAQAWCQHLNRLAELQHLRAPFAGLVLHPQDRQHGKPVIIQSGTPVAPGSALLTLVDQQRLEVVSRLEESDLHQLREGMPVQVSGEAFTRAQLSGRITRIGLRSISQPRETAWYEVVVALDNLPEEATQNIRLGMTAKLNVILYRNEQGIAVPAQALRGDPGNPQHVLWKATSQAVAQRMNVTTGPTVVEGVQVDGLSAGYIEVPGS